MDVGTLLQQSAERFAEEPAIIFSDEGGDRTVTFSELNQASNRVANGLLESGVDFGEPVGLLSKNSVEFVEAFFATQKIGAIITPINPRLTATEIEYIVSDASPNIVILEADLLSSISGLDDVLASEVDEVFLIGGNTGSHRSFSELRASQSDPGIQVGSDAIDGYMYTSGNTGKPKGVVHTHDQHISQSLGFIAEIGLRRDDVVLNTQPLFHAGPFYASLLPNIHIGASTVLSNTFDPEAVLELIEAYRITVLPAVPAQLNEITSVDSIDEYDLSSLRFWCTSGAALGNNLRKECMEKLVESYSEIYGMTEAGPTISLLPPHESADHPGTCGNGIINHELRLVDVNTESYPDPDATVDRGEIGEVVVRGSTVMDRYLNLPDRTAEALVEGWYFTGDLADRDNDGYLSIRGRKDGMIISGGENIYPAEIEDVLSRHEKIKDVAVLGVDHERWGQTPKAYIVPTEGTSLTEEDVESFCKSSTELANYKRPRVVSFVDEIPRNPGGGSVITDQLKEL